MKSDNHSRPTFEQLAEEFAERYRRGESPAPDDYARQYPEFAEEIQDLFPAMMMMEDISPDSNDSIIASGPRCRTDQKLPSQIGDFRIIRQAGRGGMGIVYEAEQVSLGRHVALKVLPELADAKQKRRFEREAKAAAKLHHTNIVPVFGVGEEQGLSYYVMQFIQGLGLDEVLDELRHLQKRGDSSVTTPGELKVSRVSHASRVRSAPNSDISAADVALSLITGRPNLESSEYVSRSDDATVQCGRSGDIANSDPSLSAATKPRSSQSSASLSSGTFSVSRSSSSHADSFARSGVNARQRTYFQSVANIGRQTAEALSYAHEQGILHRDVKPGNIILDLRGAAWVTDFGLAKANDQQDLTRTGDIVGTLRYMPPEAFDGLASPTGDIYSLGLTLYEMLAFEPAFGNRKRQQLVKQITSGTVERLDRLNPEVPRDLVTIVHRAIERNPSDRYASAAMLAEDLQHFLNDEPIKARRISYAEQFVRWSRRNKGLATSLATVAALLILVAFGSLIAARHFRDLATMNGLLVQEKQKALDNEGKALQAAVLAQHDATRQRELTQHSLYASSVFAAQQALNDSQASLKVRGLLSEVKPTIGRPDLRGWEWYYLNSFAHEPESLVIPTQKPQVTTAFHPSGDKVFSMFGGLTAHDAKTGEWLFHKDTGWSRDFFWSHNGKYVCIGGMYLWDADKWEKVVHLNDLDAQGRIAWSPDDQRLAVVGSENQIKIWNPFSPELLVTLKGHVKEIQGLDWSPDGKQIISASRDKTIRVWNANTGDEIRLVQLDVEIDQMSLAPNGKQIAIAREKNIRIFQLEEGGKASNSFFMQKTVGWTGWSPDGLHLAAAEYAGTRVNIWHVTTGRIVNQIWSPTGGFYGCGWSPDGTKLVTSGSKDVRIWNAFRDKPYRKVDARIGGSKGTFHRIAIHPDEELIASVNGNRQHEVNIWELSTGNLIDTLADASLDWHTDLLWSPDGTALAIGSEDGLIRMWEPGSERITFEMPGHEKGIRSLAWHDRGDRLASGAQDETIRIWDVASGSELCRFDTLGVPKSLNWHPTEPWIVAAVRDTVYIWDTNSRAQIATIPVPGLELRSICLTSTGNLLAVAGENSDAHSVSADTAKSVATIRVWDLEKKSEIRRMEGHRQPVNSVRWDSDGKRVVSASDDGTVRIWDVEIGHELLSLNADDLAPISTVGFSPDNLKVAAAARNGILIWDAVPGYAKELSPQLLPRLSKRVESNPKSDDLQLRARIFARSGRWDEAAADFRRGAADSKADSPTWFPVQWSAFGPFTDGSNFDEIRASIDECLAKPDSQFDPRWVADELENGHYLNFSYYSSSTEQAIGFVGLRIFSAIDQDIGCLIGVTGQMKFYCNGEMISERVEHRPVVKDDEAVDISLKSGWNSIVVEVTADESQHGLFVRFTDEHDDLARGFERVGKWASSLRHWISQEKDHPDEHNLWAQGGAALRAGRFEQARQAYDAYIEATEDKLVARRRVAEAYHIHGLQVAIDDKPKIESPEARKVVAATSLNTARTLYEQLFEEEQQWTTGQRDKHESVAGKLATSVYYHCESPSWRRLSPLTATSAGGARLRFLQDHSLLADGLNPAQDQYTVTTSTTLDNVAAVRLDPIFDRSLPNRNVGRCLSVGDYKLTELRLFIEQSDGSERELKFKTAFRAYRTADGRYDGNVTIDGDLETDFSATDEQDIIYVLDEPIKNPNEVRLKFVMDFKPGHALGRFRFSVTDNVKVVRQLEDSFKIVQNDNPYVRLGIAYQFIGETRRAAQAFARGLDVASDDEATNIVAQAKVYADVFELLRQLRPDHKALSNPTEQSNVAGLTPSDN
ncbi:MAG: protein kinase [Planctomycetales bacterium]|nr:protein kinase [Planctomycetales bacterium]